MGGECLAVPMAESSESSLSSSASSMSSCGGNREHSVGLLSKGLWCRFEAWRNECMSHMNVGCGSPTLMLAYIYKMPKKS